MKVFLGGSKDEHFSCFQTSCQTGLRELFKCRPCNSKDMQYYLYLSSDWGIGFLKDLANWISWFWNSLFFIYWIQGFSFIKMLFTKDFRATQGYSKTWKVFTIHGIPEIFDSLDYFNLDAYLPCHQSDWNHA